MTADVSYTLQIKFKCIFIQKDCVDTMWIHLHWKLIERDLFQYPVSTGEMMKPLSLFTWTPDSCFVLFLNIGYALFKEGYNIAYGAKHNLNI